MFVNWLSNNVSRFSTILCAAGMMVPWLFPNRAKAHDMSVMESVSSSASNYASPSGALQACYTWLRWECSSFPGGGRLLYSYGNISQQGIVYNARCRGGCEFKDTNHSYHWHPPESVPGLPGNLAAVDCDCGNCEYGCES